MAKKDFQLFPKKKKKNSHINFFDFDQKTVGFT